MAASCRFAFAVHILAALACHPERGMSSQLLAGSVNTNAVVIRRILSELRSSGLIETCKGAGGGARLSRDPQSISLAEVYRAIDGGAGFSLHPQEPNQRCPVGRKIEAVLTEVFSAAQAALEAELARRTLADVVEELEAAPPGS